MIYLLMLGLRGTCFAQDSFPLALFANTGVLALRACTGQSCDFNTSQELRLPLAVLLVSCPNFVSLSIVPL